MTALSLPHKFLPRPYQLPLLGAIDNAAHGRGPKRIYTVWHRRAGKDICLWNMIIKEAFERMGIYYYLLPTAVQARKVIWDGGTDDGFKFMDFIPKELISGTPNVQEMKITLAYHMENGLVKPGGSIIQLIGTDNPDSIRGSNPFGMVFSEFAWHDPRAWEIARPILAVNKGWAAFNTTFNFRNHAWDMWSMAQDSKDWWTQSLTIRDTNVLTEADIDKERREGMSEEMVQQEYYNNPDVGALGAYYGPQMAQLRHDGRLCAIPIMKGMPVDLWMDLGRNDTTVIIFTQQLGKEVRAIDYYEKNGEDIDHYIRYIKEKNYLINCINLPHDAKQHRLETKNSIEEQFRKAGFKTRIVESGSLSVTSLVSGIMQVRKIFPRIWIDNSRCKGLVKALDNYRREYDYMKKTFKDHPYHDDSSNGADAFRILCMGLKEPKIKTIQKNTKSYNPFSAF